MNRTIPNYIILKMLSILNVALLSSALQYDCSRSEYERCVKMADPLVKEVHLIFPDNKQDIDIVCRTWNNFVDCLKKYTDTCFTSQQRLQFNKAIENPIESVHQMCMQPNYQKEYLQYAPCMKSTVVDGARCGPHYNLLVDQVDQGDIISKATLCCSHDRFKQCVLKETREICDRGIPDGPAARFSAQIIDKALSFLQEQCYNYIPNSGDCTTITTDNLPFSDTLMISTSPSEVYPWSTVQEMERKEILPSRVIPPRATPTSWLPSSSLPDISDSSYSQFDTTYPVSTQNLGTRSRPSSLQPVSSRPASYGRASTFSDASINENTPPGINSRPGLSTHQGPNIHSELSTYSGVNTQPSFGVSSGSNPQPGLNPSQTFSDVLLSTSPVRSGGSTVTTWTVVNPSPGLEQANTYESDRAPVDPTFSSSTTWFPAAGSQLSNEVDEPNQMGLVKPENNGHAELQGCFVLTIIVAVLNAFC